MGRRPKPRWRGVPQQEAASVTAQSAHDARIKAVSGGHRPRLRLGSKDAFREETFERFLETFLPYAGGGGERPAAKCVATFFNGRVRHLG